MPLTVRELVEELAGDVCRCGKRKKKRQTFCSKCYFSLSASQRADLYNTVGFGYEEAYEAAVKTLESK